MNQVQSLITLIGQLGLDKKYVRSVLPDWAESYPPSSETELAQLKVYLAGALNLDLGSLLANKPAFAVANKVRYKRLKKQQDEVLTPATALFSALARYCIGAVSAPYRPLPADPAVFRAEILAEKNGPLSLEGLVTQLWSRGIPVVHYRHLPEKLSRPDALVLKIGSSPVVVVGGKRVHPAWHLFYVAHEAGHIAKNHVGDDDVLVDESLSGSETNAVDRDELEANNYASTLLCGTGDIQYLPTGVIDCDKLSRLSVKLGKEQRISPGHVLLRHAAQHNVWPTAMKVLAQIEGSESGAKVINRIAAEHIDWKSIAPESAAIVRRALQL